MIDQAHKRRNSAAASTGHRPNTTGDLFRNCRFLTKTWNRIKLPKLVKKKRAFALLKADNCPDGNNNNSLSMIYDYTNLNTSLGGQILNISLITKWTICSHDASDYYSS